MYNEQLEALINAAIIDGNLTEKEREILFSKALSQGIDLDEFEMILQAKLYERQQVIGQSNPPQQTAPPPPVAVAPPSAPAPTQKSDKFGDIRKCPSCGSVVQAYSAKCGDCGHEFTNIAAVSSVTNLFEQLQNIEYEERNRQVDSGWMEKIQGNAAANQQLEERIKKRKASLISSFPVPNTKEDILEFLSMAVPEANKKPNFLMRLTAAGDLHKAWFSKVEQVIMKAKFSLKEDKKALEEIMYYAKDLGIK